VYGNKKKLPQPIRISVFHGRKKVFEKVFERYPIIIGRNPSCDVPLSQYDFISRQHATITLKDKQPVILDLESANGLFVSEKRIRQAPIDSEIQVRLGELNFEFSYTEESIFDANTLVDHTFETRKIPHSKLPPIPQSSKPPKAKIEAIPKQKPPKKKQEKGFALNELPEKFEQPRQEYKSPQPAKAIPVEHNIHDDEASGKTLFRHPSGGVGADLLEPHPYANQLKPTHRVLEAYVTWKDQVWDLQQFLPGEKVTLGTGERANLSLPLLKLDTDFAAYDGHNTRCLVPNGASVEIRRGRQTLSMDYLKAQNALTPKGSGHTLQMGNEDLCTVQLAGDVKVHFRYAPAPRQLSKHQIPQVDEDFRSPLLASGIFYVFMIVFIWVNAPDYPVTPIKNVPERFARLIMKPPKPIIKKKPKKKKIVKKKTQKKKKIVKKRQRRPRKVVVKRSNKLKKINKFPIKVKKKPVEVKKIGALAALSALRSKPTTKPVSVNINKNAGGMKSLNTGGVIGTLKTKSGRLAAAGHTTVKTKGLGYGSGTGYGIQGLKGKAGGRAVAGAVVGTPKLVKLSKKQGLSRNQVLDVVKKHIAKIQQCYERSLFSNPDLAGKVTYEWFITPRGGVTWAKVKATRMRGGDTLHRCVTGVFKRMKFPKAKNRQSTVATVPFPFGRL
jgi:pSer/pThr/pTyr-binding forkhead associated (FHA) protein